jgi:predicted dienelactone hydrolase
MPKFAAGYREGLLSDPRRTNWQGDANRPLNWSCWYPAGSQAPLAEQVAGPPNTPAFTNGLVAPDAALNDSGAPYPLVLLSHGTGGSALSLGWLGAGLARHGFVVLGVNHHGNTAREPYLPEGFICWWERMRDLSFLLDWIEVGNLFRGRIDPARTYAAGMSLGGYTVLGLAGAITSLDRFQAWAKGKPGADGPREFPNIAGQFEQLMKTSEPFRMSLERQGNNYLDDRVKAVLALCPAPTVRAFSPESISSISMPVRIICGAADKEAPADDCALWLGQQNPSFAVEILPGDVGHYVFISEATEIGRKIMPDICIDPPGVDRKAVHKLSLERALELFAPQ